MFRQIKTMKAITVAFFVLGASALATTAATVNATVDFNGGTTTGGATKTYTEDGFQFYSARIVGGPCQFAGADKCAALNPNETTVLTKVGGGSFDFTSVWFYLNGKVSDGLNGLRIFDTNNTSHIFDFTQPTYSHNTGYTAALDFAGVTSITFASSGDKGNARFDTGKLGFTSTVPVPAAGVMLVSGLGALV
jgi:hypothetical protein